VVGSKFKQGDILSYPYLWEWQAEKGEMEGRKERPVCVALPLRREGVTHLFLLAVSGTPPRPEQKGVSIPEIERRRAGLKEWKEAWVIIDECNYDIAERSFHLDPSQNARGRFSESFTKRIKDSLRNAIEDQSMIRIDRTVE